MIPRIRIDDVLQGGNYGHWVRFSMKERSLFDWFKYATEKHGDYPFILAVVADGVEKEREWVKYINNHPKWEVQCHGLRHKSYNFYPLEVVRDELRDAKHILEANFNNYITRYYPPKMRYNDMTREAARQIGLEETRERFTIKHYVDGKVPEGTSEIYMHYWNPAHIKLLWQVLAGNS